MNSRVHCATIPPGQPFAATLAGWVLEHYGRGEQPLTRVMLLLPNRRSVLAMREAFLNQSEGRPLLLPRIMPISDLENELLPEMSASHEAMPIHGVRRRMLLMRLVQQYESQRTGRACQAVHALRLADELMRFLDEVHRAGLSLERLDSLAPQELSEHWQQTLRFLKLVSEHWPAMLEQEHAVEPAAYRRQKLLALARHWSDHPPDYPVIAAGSTGSQDATAELLSAVARLPQGLVVLPCLDLDMEDSQWKQVDCTHPQFGMKQLIERMGISLRDVTPLTAVEGNSARQQCMRAIFAPAAVTAGWRESHLPLKEGLAGVSYMESMNTHDEARLVACLLRETLEEPGKTCALVTQDRMLARMVAAQMRRFGITIDDSAGAPLLDTPPATFLRLAARCVLSGAAPVPLLALLQHPLAAAGGTTERCRDMARQMDRLLLRGVRHTPGLEALVKDAQPYPELCEFLKHIRKIYEPAALHFHSVRPSSYGKLLQVHLDFAEAMADTGKADGAARLWKGEAAREISGLLADVISHASDMGNIEPGEYVEFFDSLFSGAVHRQRFGAHPRLHILSPMEARLQTYGRIVLAGLNEGMWPMHPEADPWMSRPMREVFGMDPPEQSVGMSAHDFYTLCHAPEIVLSRSRKSQGAPAVASRWLVRLQILLQGLDAGLAQTLDCSLRAQQMLEQLDPPAEIPAMARPEPRPPVSARPSRMRVTHVDWWVRDPYMIYARYVLGLEKLRPLDEDPGTADLGVAFHAIFEKFVHRYPSVLPDDALDQLMDIGRQVLAAYGDRPAIAMLWWPRFETLANWFVQQEHLIRPLVREVLAERKGSLLLEAQGQRLLLATRIDRIEIRSDGSVVIADYKTGSVPTSSQIESGLANQLALEALVLRDGQVEPPIPLGGIEPSLYYWKLSAGADGPRIREVKVDVEKTRENILSLLAQYAQSSMPYAAQTNPALRMPYNDYLHLTRYQEWETV